MDVNKDIYRKSIRKDLTMSEDLQMIEAVGNCTGKKIGATFFRGTKPIDGVWVTSDVVIIEACVMPTGYGIEDHRLFVLDFLTLYLIGHDPPKIVRAAARRINTNIPSGELYYINRLEQKELPLIVDLGPNGLFYLLLTFILYNVPIISFL